MLAEVTVFNVRRLPRYLNTRPANRGRNVSIDCPSIAFRNTMHTHSFRRTAIKAVCCAATVFGFNSLVNAAPAPAKPAASSADDLATLPGFKVEVVLEAERAVHGSWISLG